MSRDSKDPAQYQQCINENLFNSPLDDDVLIKRLESLPQGDRRQHGCLAVHHDPLQTMLGCARELVGTAGNAEIIIHPASSPAVYRSHARHVSINMGGGILLKSPFCCSVQLEQPFFWLASLALTDIPGLADLIGRAGWLSRSQLELTYHLELRNPESIGMRILLAGTDLLPQEAGRAERSFWLYERALPADARSGVSLEMDPQRWLPLQGHPQESYGLKCRASAPQQMDLMKLELILAIDVASQGSIAGQLTLPVLRITSGGLRPPAAGA